jgi:hypothetical protein
MKKLGMLVGALLVVAGIVAIVGVNSARKAADRFNDWSQTNATVDRVDGSMVTIRYEAGGSNRRVPAEGREGASYRPGESVLVYVNPADPMEAILELPPRPSTWPITAGAVSILVGALLLGFLWRGGMSKPSTTTRRGPGDATGTRRRPAPPLARLQPPPGVKRNRDGEDQR